ncbi:DNA-binding response OmpR family regulator [Chitinophaga skermanii]|uniref:DNA-binding response OmpR family regulator n=1 Tax=Chitinophaga skermanii TaxID=331697 RepID=A0A327QY53_9BACT|nr:response regulator transcription factor [Chitinophaga skermanii]RAJ08542.1 DNA-binding response OmpR family regulator [Chitinophaga skermanii]
MSTKPQILLVEDETDLGNVVKQYLDIMGFDVTWRQDGPSALALLQENPHSFKLLLVDVSMPTMDGFEFANHAANINPHLPFIFLTARNEKQDRLHGLKLGADDYIVKPFDVDELVLRIKNIIKRNAGVEVVGRNMLNKGDVKFYKDTLQLVIEGQKEIMLTPREAELLEFLFRHANRVLKREEILTQLWGENDYFFGRSLDVFISRLRKYLGKSKHINISNVYGVGFVFNVNE